VRGRNYWRGRISRTATRATSAIQHQRRLLALIETQGAPVVRGVATCRRVAVDLQVALDQVHDPVNRNAGPSVEATLPASVSLQAGIRHLDDKRHVRGARVAIRVVVAAAADDGCVGLGFAGLQRDGLLSHHVPAIRQQPQEELPGSLGGDRVGWILGHLRDQPPVQELNGGIVR